MYRYVCVCLCKGKKWKEQKMEAEQFLTAKIILSVVLGGLIGLFVYLYHVLWLKPMRLRSKLQNQGIKGPSSPSFLYGNIPEMKRIQFQTKSKSNQKEHHHHQEGSPINHNWPATVFPHIQQWRDEYGPVFVYSTGNVQTLCITDPEMAKEVSLCTSRNLGKPSYISRHMGALLGRGIFTSSGQYWAQQRKIIAPEFYLPKVMGMLNLMVDSTTAMLNTWERKINTEEGTVDIRVDEDLRSLSADIISRACFGSNYSQGEKIFSAIRTLQKIISKENFGVPGSRYLPTKNNREIWRIEKDINSMILKLVKARSEAKCEKDLLQVILEAAKTYRENGDLPVDITPNKFIVDNCKSLYLAGHDTTTIAVSWCLMLLAMHPEWQAQARSEVFEICGKNPPDADMLRSMKTLTMVIQESLRLYPPVAYTVREILEDINFRGIQIPKDFNLQIHFALMHQLPDLWGPDVYQFKPERFANGTNGACKIPQVYMPFGTGPRICAAQQFAMTELKVIVSLILSRFSFSLSPAYRHSPMFRLVIAPEHGIILRVRRV